MEELRQHNVLYECKNLKKKYWSRAGQPACSHNHSWKAVGSREASIAFNITFKDFILQEISLNGWIDTNLDRRAFLSEGLPAAFSDKDQHLHGNVGLSLKSKMASILYLPLLKNGLELFPYVSWVRRM